MIVQDLSQTCHSSVLYVTANENYLLDHDENAAIDADQTISTFVADRSHSDHMCALGIHYLHLNIDH